MGKHRMPRPYEDLSGMRYGRLSVLSYAGQNENRNSLWKVRCDCGVEFVTLSTAMKSGGTRSCGCLRVEMLRERARKKSAGPMKESGTRNKTESDKR